MKDNMFFKGAIAALKAMGHPYIDEEGNGRSICKICKNECEDYKELVDHLKSLPHQQMNSRLSDFPFNDNLVFFSGIEKATNEIDEIDNELHQLSIPLKQHNNEFDIDAKWVGTGVIGARFIRHEKSGIGIKRIWLEWYATSEDTPDIEPLNFALVIINNGKLEDVKSMICTVCSKELLPNTDVAALVDEDEQKLLCNNDTGEFHVSHVSCVINWILYQESQRIVNDEMLKIKDNPKFYVPCLRCEVKKALGEQLEGPSITLPQLEDSQEKVTGDAERWNKNGELLGHSAVGLEFEFEEYIERVKRMTFYYVP